MTHHPTDAWMRRLGTTDVVTSAVVAGGSPLGGGMEWAYGDGISHAEAVDLVTAIADSPIRGIDTSNMYGRGDSERRIGAALTRIGGVPEDFTVFTKTDALDGDYSADRMRRSFEESAERLGIDRFGVLYLHDPEHATTIEAATARGGAVEGMLALKDEGRVQHIGLAGGDSRVMSQYLDLGIFDVLLTHSRYSLVDRSADALIDQARADGLGVVNAAVFGGGLLAKPATATKYGYRDAHPAVLDAVRAMDAACVRHGVTLATAALQFSLRDPRIDATVVGFTRPERIDATVTSAQTPLSDELLQELRSLTPPSTTWLDSPSR